MIREDLTGDSVRTKAVVRHISLTFIYKIIAVGLNFLLISLTVDYLDVERYGVWVIIISIMSWVTFFDIGLGNGMRNKLTEALAVKDVVLAKTYVSTGYFLICFISLLLICVHIGISYFAPWNKIFNTTVLSQGEFASIVFVLGVSFIVNLVLSLSNQIFSSYQEASVSPLSQLILNVIVLISVWLLITYAVKGNLFYLSVCYSLSMIISGVVITYWFYIKHKEVFPSFKSFSLGKIKEIGSLGGKFFVLKIAVLVIFTTDNLIITQVLGPKSVTPYAIVFKLFAGIIIIHSICGGPLWSAYTDAFFKNDIKWIKRVLKNLNKLVGINVLIVCGLIIFSRDIIRIWIGEVDFPNSLPVFMGIYALVRIWSSNYSSFLNGIGKVNFQLITAIVGAVINIPLSIYLAKNLNMGVNGIVLGSIISLSFFAIGGPIQTYSILKNSLGGCRE